MASVLLSAFTVCMSVISFLILDDQRCFLAESKSHIGWMSCKPAKRLYAVRLLMCTVDGTTHDHVTRRDEKQAQTEEKFYPPPLFRLSRLRSFHAFPRRRFHFASVDCNYYSRWRERVSDSTLEGYILRVDKRT